MPSATGSTETPSDLDLEQMRERCPRSEPLLAARLRRHRLTFAGYSSLWDGGVATLADDPSGNVVELFQPAAWG